MTWDTIEFEIDAPVELEGTKVTGNLLMLTRTNGSLRYSSRELIGLGEMVHFGGPRSKVYRSRILLDSDKFASIEELTDQWAMIDGAVGTLTVTPRTVVGDDEVDLRATATWTNVLAMLDTFGEVSSGPGSSSRIMEFTFKRITPYGV